MRMRRTLALPFHPASPDGTLGKSRPEQPSVNAFNRVLGSPDRVEAPADQHFDVRIGFGNGAENRPPTKLRFDIADPDLQMPLVVLAGPDEG